ncbi:MAG TPA: glycosyltransferase family 1 protein [Patescibacteria group bacterium]|nr:glycosyltransferase family 1 protein [Patescibacteria group bacterium]
MNIAIDIRCLMERELTGVGEYTFHLLKHLFEIDNQNNYYLFYNSRQNVSPYIPEFPKKNIHYCQFRLPNKLLNLSLKFFKYPRLDKMIEKKYHTPEIDLFFFPNICFSKTSCPFMITAHDLSFEFFNEFLSFKRKLWHKFINPKKIFNQAEKIVAVSENTRQDLQTHYNLSFDKIEIIYSGISNNYKIVNPNDPNLKKVKKKYNLPKKFILYLGTIEPRKNIQGLITFFQEFQKKHPEYSLVIAGKHGWKYKEIKKTDCRKIIFTDFISDLEKRYFYNLADMFIYPSFYEGFGFPPLEAMACGCPVITSNNSSLSEICGQTAILIDPNNQADLLFAAEQMLEKTTRESYVERGLTKVKYYNWYTTAQALLNNFEQTIKS